MHNNYIYYSADGGAGTLIHGTYSTIRMHEGICYFYTGHGPFSHTFEHRVLERMMDVDLISVKLMYYNVHLCNKEKHYHVNIINFIYI